MAGKKDKVKDCDRFSVVLENLSVCFLCGSGQMLSLHEIFHGPANRSKSKEDGMVVCLCYNDHQGLYGVHNFPPKDNKLKQIGEKAWIKKYATDCDMALLKIDKFINRYGKNFLEESDV